MKYDDLIKYFGSGYKVSLDCNISAGAPYNWKKQGYIPIKTQMLIEKLTKGELKADLAHCRRESVDDK